MCKVYQRNLIYRCTLNRNKILNLNSHIVLVTVILLVSTLSNECCVQFFYLGISSTIPTGRFC